MPSVNDGSSDTQVIPFSSLLKKLPGSPSRFLESYISFSILTLSVVWRLCEGLAVPIPIELPLATRTFPSISSLMFSKGCVIPI